MYENENGIPDVLRTSVFVSVKYLGEEKAPTSIGYNDMAIMIAFGKSTEIGIPTVNANMVSKYLKRHSAVPADARMESDKAQKYLDELCDSNLIEREGEAKDKNYRMRDDIGTCILERYEELKSEKIDILLFHGFRIHSALSRA